MRAGSSSWAGSSLAVAAMTLGALGCGSGAGNASKASSSRPGRPSPRRLYRAPSEPSVTATVVGQLPAAVADPAAVSLDNSRLVLLGGLNGTDTSSASITVWPGGAGIRSGALPVP